MALIAGLTASGGDDAQTVAAVLIYRLLTYVLPIALGACTYLYWRRNQSWVNSAPPLPMSIASVSSPESSAHSAARRDRQVTSWRDLGFGGGP